jgi:hypothetical protein
MTVRWPWSPTTVIEGLLARHESIFLCKSCSWKLGPLWTIRYEYRPFRLYAGMGDCDYCRKDGWGTLWLPEDGAWWQERRTIDAIHEASRLQGIKIRDRRRVTLG